MTGAARLLSVRVQGFKSFAEKTHVSFGPGISAIVGPNGSGKSNLADALRWALGEQGRALRSRHAEDVIWAGSERRSAVGMADVQLTLDNGDGLLPVDFEVVELGRRLYRSGENDYLLNRQRVRLRDLLELLDAAHLAENAFLFIGQGMVDQALALRPEERRPLFEEVAGVRRHDRRRRRAEEQLVESESNLARIEDILGELRPQARRLAAQAEQQANRLTAADDLAAAIVTAGHARWHAAAGRLAEAAAVSEGLRTAVDAALARLSAAEEEVAAISSGLAGRAETAAVRRADLEAARTALTALQLRDGRMESELAAISRDRQRLGAEREAAEADLANQRRRLAEPPPRADPTLLEELSGVNGQLQDALRDSTDSGLAAGAGAPQAAEAARLATARDDQAEVARRRANDAERVAAVELERAAALDRRSDGAATAHTAARGMLDTAIAAEVDLRRAREAAEHELSAAIAAAASAGEKASRAAAALASAEARLESARGAAAALEQGTFASAARAGGGRRLGRDVSVEPGLRAAVDAALSGVARAYIVSRGRIRELGGEQGTAVVAEAIPSGGSRREPTAAAAAVIDRVRERGGGWLADAVRRDDDGGVRRLLERAVWLPDLGACLESQAALPVGWIAVPRDGGAVVGDVTVHLRPADRMLEWRADLDRIDKEVAAGAEQRATLTAAAQAADSRAAAQRAMVAEARTAEVSAAADRRRAEDQERAAGRAAESIAREASWQASLATRATAELERARAALPAPPPEASSAADPVAGGAGHEADQGEVQDRQARQEHVEQLRTRRERLTALVAEAERTVVESERSRARAEAAAALDEQRITAAESAEGSLADHEAGLLGERAELGQALADASAAESAARSVLDGLLANDRQDRERLAVAERGGAAERDRLRAAEERSRAAEREALEARLGVEALREQLLVELAGLGELGLRALLSIANPRANAPADPAAAGVAAGTEVSHLTELAELAESAALEAALTAAGERWAARAPAAEAPSPGRLAALRRRFHELGAANPFAVEEYAALRTRLEELESQHADLRQAIDRTRALIVELEGLIARQFRATFEALEAAFGARFRQLFGGGFARLSLTDPSDLSTTGVEIVASPPGKKAQALAMLSGGERALTAVALLFAMLEVRPVPFCVLDEVDAALDEANIGRFSDALRELSARTQCIVITHNRGTIETADALYGVTVGDDSVSRVVSLRLDEATAIATMTTRSREASRPTGPDGATAPSAPEPETIEA